MGDFETVSLTEWYNGQVFNDKRLPIVDIREIRHDGALMTDDTDVVVVHLALSTLLSGERSCELPPRHVSFAVLTDEAVLEAARTFFGATTSKATQQSRKPWLVPQVLISNENLWKEASTLGILLTEKEKSEENAAFKPQPRLWQPDPMVKNVLWPLLRNQSFSTLTPPPHSKEICDLGSGAGRDVCFLAEQAKASNMDCYKFVGIDNHKGSMKRCLPFWKHRQVEEYTEARNLNLNKVAQVQDEWKNCNVACLYAVRFWNVKLVTCIANDEMLLPGTLFALSHFCKPYSGAPWDFDHPKACMYIYSMEIDCIHGFLSLTSISTACSTGKERIGTR
jgi:hypothetical protein